MGDSKSTKSALKEARDLIGAKDYGPALRCCKRILNQDSAHLLALIFSGKCQQEMDQIQMAEKVTKKKYISPKKYLKRIFFSHILALLFFPVLFASRFRGRQFCPGLARSGPSLREDPQERQ